MGRKKEETLSSHALILLVLLIVVILMLVWYFIGTNQIGNVQFSSYIPEQVSAGGVSGGQGIQPA